MTAAINSLISTHATKTAVNTAPKITG